MFNTACLVSGLISACPCSARETVEFETPRDFAISMIVVWCLLLFLPGVSASVSLNVKKYVQDLHTYRCFPRTYPAFMIMLTSLHLGQLIISFFVLFLFSLFQMHEKAFFNPNSNLRFFQINHPHNHISVTYSQTLPILLALIRE